MLAEFQLLHIKLEKVRASSRFKRVIGRLIASGLLRSKVGFEAYRQKVALADLLWAGQYEPRIYEFVPAILIKRPSLLKETNSIPKDLASVLTDIRAGKATLPFRGVEACDYLKWLSFVGRKDTTPSLLKNFRFKQEDLRILHELKEQGYSEMEAVRAGLRLLAGQSSNR